MFDDGDPDWLSARGAALARVLPGVDLAALSDDRLLDAVGGWARFVAFGEARLYAALGELAARRSGQPDAEFLADEVAAELRLSRAAAETRLSLAEALRSRLPGTFAALEDGRIDGVRARSVVEITDVLSDAAARDVERSALPRAEGQTNQQLRAALRRASIAADPAAADKRAEAARASREVRYVPADDGMGVLMATLPAHDARSVFTTVDQLAWQAKVAGDDRAIGALRADTFVDLVRAGAERIAGGCDCGGGESRGRASTRTPVGAQVQVVVPAATLAGTADEPGELIGHGPIPPGLAREIASDATWRRILTDPASGAVLDYGTSVYTAPPSLGRHVKARDRTCRFPGCRQPAYRCDLDHTERFPDGATAHDNLGLLCRRHHRLKHEGGWRLRQDAPGVFTWTSPLKREYTVRPPDIGPSRTGGPPTPDRTPTTTPPPPDDENRNGEGDTLSPVA